MEEPALVVFVIATGAWLGCVAATTWTGSRVRARGDAAAGVAWAERHRRLTTLVAVPSALIALGSGIWAVLDRDLSIDPNWWIGTGIGAWVVAFLGSTLPRGPLLRRAVARAVQLGPDEEDVRWQVRQVSLVVRGELLLLVVAAVVIALRPTGEL